MGDDYDNGGMKLYGVDDFLYVTRQARYHEEHDGRTLLSIRRSDSRLELQVNQMQYVKNIQFTKNIIGLVGLIRLIHNTYLIVITKAEVVATIITNKIFRILEFDMIPVHKDSAYLNELQMKMNEEYLNMLMNFLRTPFFYFSLDMDLTHVLQEINSYRRDNTNCLFSIADTDYLWNHNLVADFGLDQRNYLVPIIFGFAEMTSVDLGILKGDFILISRRNRRHAGTRFTRRGIDCDGDVANFVQTEQIFIGSDNGTDYIYSFTQIRGSIPLFWSQKVNLKYKPSIQLKHPKNEVSSFQAHMNKLTDKYGKVVSVNLVNQTGSEAILEEAFQRLMNSLPYMDYIAYDFHKETKQFGWETLGDFINRLDKYFESIDLFRFAASMTGRNETKNLIRAFSSIQKGVFRTNCIDCLDRTNVLQSMLGFRCLKLAIEKDFQIDLSLFKQFDMKFKNIWANNGDALSVQYAGTGALKSDFTRTGLRTWMGIMNDGMNAMQRYVYNNFYDGTRQDAIDLFLNEYNVSNDEGSIVRCPIQATWFQKHGWKIIFASYFTFALTMIYQIIPAETFRRQTTYLTIWSGTTMLLLLSLVVFGPKIVNRPKLKQD
ncbi:hypothetical protein SNEBB_001083 [Seison nebaliae]|nr:hypothetical protein SNEBB_001083 [Seison nebaliae]